MSRDQTERISVFTAHWSLLTDHWLDDVLQRLAGIDQLGEGGLLEDVGLSFEELVVGGAGE